MIVAQFWFAITKPLLPMQPSPASFHPLLTPVLDLPALEDVFCSPARYRSALAFLPVYQLVGQLQSAFLVRMETGEGR